MPQPAPVTTPPPHEHALLPAPDPLDEGLQLRLFPSTAAASSQTDLTAALDLRVADELCGMYYIG